VVLAVVNHVLYIGCYKDLWGTDCRKPCNIYIGFYKGWWGTGCSKPCFIYRLL